MTISEIANRAGVSKSTVSRVINGSEKVDPQTRSNVLKVIKEYDYIPLAAARGLSRKKSMAIGFVVPEIDSVFFGQIAQGINDSLENTDYSLLLCCTKNNIDLELKALRMLRQQNVCGLIITSSCGYYEIEYTHKIIDSIRLLNVPVVTIDRLISGTSWNGVYSDFFNGAYELASVLINANIDSIAAFFSDMLLNLGKERYQGFNQAMSDHNMKIPPGNLHFIDGPASFQHYYNYFSRMIDEGPLPKALFFSNGIIANSFYKAALEKKIKIGKDVHCASFDWTEAIDVSSAPCTYLERNCELIGNSAISILFNFLCSQGNKHEVMQNIIIPSHLHIDKNLLKQIKSL